MPAWGDPAILNEILRVGRSIRNPRIRRIYERAAVQTGLVESGGRNLSGGDADSAGWRQERASLYRNPTNVRASVKRFRDEFLQQYDPGEKSYQVAAQVQRPREDLRGRYHDVAREAAQLLKGRGLAGGGGGLEQLLAGGSVGARQMPQGSEGVAALLATLGEKPQVPSSGGLQAPAFSAQAAMPAGAQVPEGSAPAPKQDIDGLLEAVRTLGGDIAHAPGTDAVSGAAGGSTGGAGPRGRVVVDPNADRAGVHTHRAVVDFAAQVAGIAGTRVRIGTGTNHSRLTVNGNVSDHWAGNAADIPASGRRLIRLGQAALIAAGMSPARARKQRGGLYNVGGKQIIFNTQEGGDHTTHLHLGLGHR